MTSIMIDQLKFTFYILNHLYGNINISILFKMKMSNMSKNVYNVYNHLK